MQPITIDNLVRYSHNLFKTKSYHPTQDGLERDGYLRGGGVIDKIEDLFNREAARILLEPGSAVIWNNHMCLHGREHFAHADRRLKRCVIY